MLLLKAKALLPLLPSPLPLPYPSPLFPIRNPNTPSHLRRSSSQRRRGAAMSSGQRTVADVLMGAARAKKVKKASSPSPQPQSLPQDPSPPSKKPKNLEIQESKDEKKDPSIELKKKASEFNPRAAASWKDGDPVPFLFLARALDLISNESGRLAITEILCNTFRAVIATTPKDLLPAVYLSANRIAPPHVGLELGIGDASLIKALAEAFGRREEHVKKQLKELGDLGLVAKASRSSQKVMFRPQPLTITKVLDTFHAIAKESGKDSQDKKRNHIKSLLVAATDCEPQYIIRLLQSKMRIGLAEKTVLVALGQAAVLSEKLPPPPVLVQSPLEEVKQSHGRDVPSMIPCYHCRALNILKLMPEETRNWLSGKGYFPQSGFIMQCIPVPPNCLCVPEISDGKSIMSSDISMSMLRKVLKKIELIKKSRSGQPNFESHEVESSDLQSSIANYMLFRGTTKTPQDISRNYAVGTDAIECSAKKWLEKMKQLFISKGSGFSSRSIITGDAYIGINEIGLPSEVAKRITFEERVTVHNEKLLQKMVDAGLCVTYRDGFSTYAITVGSKGHTSLRIGQVINRQIMDGDMVFVNRPPSTHKHSLQAFSVYIHDDHTVKINPLICAPLGADFDGDCIHVFYPQSLAAKAEVVELFSVEKQLLSSHDGNLHLKLVHDSLLALKLISNIPLVRHSTAQPLSMHVSLCLPPPALVKVQNFGSFWSVFQILHGSMPACVDSFGERYLIKQSEILKLDFNRDILQSSFMEIISSIFTMKGPKEALKFFNTLQPLLMEMLYLEGYSISLKDFDVEKAVIEDVCKNVQEISSVLHESRLLSNEFAEVQVENHLKICKMPITTFILKHSAMGNLIDSKSNSAILKVVQQLRFLGLQLYNKGKLYSKTIVDDVFMHFATKYFTNVDLPSEAYGLVKSSFFNGLNSYEALIHSISSREVIVRSSRGLTEPEALFKNLMAILRDVIIYYDKTVRNVCSSAIVQFEYCLSNGGNLLCDPVPGDPVGVLAATAISNPAYKAVLDFSQSTNSSWELMKEILLCKVNHKNDAIDRQVILYLNDCFCGKKFCKENAALTVLNCLKRITLKDCTNYFSIE